MESYYRDFGICVAMRILLYTGVIASALALANCGYTRSNTTVSGSAAPGSIVNQGSTLGTWNRTPQGGIDEKSNRAPTEPSD